MNLFKRLLRKTIGFFSGYGLTKFYPVRIFLNFIKNKLRISNQIVEVEGNKIFLDPTDTLELSLRGKYEPFETKIVKKEIKKGNIVLDIGAHIGYYTLLFARLVGNTGKVFSFEPEPAHFKILQKNVEINEYKNVILEQKAVSNKSGKDKLFLCNDFMGKYRMASSEKNRKFIEIETIKLDDYFKNFDKKIDFIKIDVEGAEYLALEGMRSLLENNKNVKIITEFSPASLKEFGVKSEEFLNLLINYGFKLFYLDEQKKEIKPVSISYLLKNYTPEKEYIINLLCLK